MSKIFLIDTNFIPLNPIHPAQARQLLRNKKAVIFRRYPFPPNTNPYGYSVGLQGGK
jgi:hypothetical protein